MMIRGGDSSYVHVLQGVWRGEVGILWGILRLGILSLM